MKLVLTVFRVECGGTMSVEGEVRVKACKDHSQVQGLLFTFARLLGRLGERWMPVLPLQSTGISDVLSSADGGWVLEGSEWVVFFGTPGAKYVTNYMR